MRLRAGEPLSLSVRFIVIKSSAPAPELPSSVRTINQQQLARQLRLSRTTVSRSLANHPAISAETRERVLAAAAKSGYQSTPGRAARRVRAPKQLTIGVLIGTPLVAADRATFPHILQGIRDRAAIEHLAVDVLSIDPAALSNDSGRRQLFRQIRKAGWRVTAWPVNYRTGHGIASALETAFPVRLQEFEWGTREWVGLLAYWLMGRTDALFPAP